MGRFFFILSGFIISYSFDSKNESQKKDSSGYLFNRFSRIYPLHLVMTLIFIFFIFDKTKSVNPTSLLESLLLMQSWVPDQSIYWGLNAVSWSISDEAFFYVAFLFLIKLTKKSILSLFISLLVVIVSFKLSTPASVGDSTWLFYINPAFRIVDFICGMLLFHLYKILKNKENISFALATLLETTSVAVMIAFVYAGINLGVSNAWRCDIFYIIPMSFVILTFSLERGAISRAMSNKVFVFLGEASFSLYMIHTTIFAMFYLHIYQYFYAAHVSSYTTLAYLLAFCVISSCIVYEFFEKPMNNYLKRFYKRNLKDGASGTPPTPSVSS